MLFINIYENLGHDVCFMHQTWLPKPADSLYHNFHVI